MLERRAAAAVSLAVLLGLIGQYLFFRQPLGLNVVLIVLLFLAAAWSLRAPEAPIPVVEAWLPAGAVAFAAFCAIRADVPLLAFDALAAIGLALATVAAWNGVSITALPIGALIAQGWSVGERTVLGAIDPLLSAWPRMRGAPRRYARASGYVGGLGLAAPFVVVFALLFSSADAVFARWLEDALDLERVAELLRESPGRIFIALAIAWPALGALVVLWRPPREHLSAVSRSLLAADTATVTLLVIDALFAAFVVLQLAYLFGGRDTLDAAAITYSAYARRGFFELIGAVTLVGALLFGLELAVRTRGRAYVMAAVTLIALTVVVLVSGWYRLHLYQQAYGWTELRFYATCAIAFLAGALAIFAWCVVGTRMRYAAQPLAVAALAVAFAANAMGPTSFVARMNLERFLEPSNLPEDAVRALDAEHLMSLGGGAIGEVVDAFARLPLTERVQVDILLRRELARVDEDRVPAWQGWNRERERARAALVHARDELLVRSGRCSRCV